MRRTGVIFILGVALGFIGGSGVMLVYFPFLFPPPQVNETVADISPTAESRQIGETSFREDAPGQDPVHWGRGHVGFYLGESGVLMEFRPDFETGPGPDYWIYLNSRAAINDEEDFLADSDRVRLAKLKSFSGSQVYKIDANQFAKSESVTVWCETFGQYIASADIPANIH